MNPVDIIGDHWAEIGMLMPMSPRAPPMPRHRPISLEICKRRSIPSRTMVKSAIKTLMRNPRAGVSLVAIKKYIVENYCNDFSNVESRFRYVKRYIKTSLEKGELIRTKGSGVAGSFRFPYTQDILKKTLKKTKKNKSKRPGIKKVKAIRKQAQQQIKELSSIVKRGFGGEPAVTTDHSLLTADGQAGTVKAVSKTSLRKIRKSTEVCS